jgi:hypothetical protein
VHIGDDGTVGFGLTVDLESIKGGSRRGILGALMRVLWPLVLRRRLHRGNDQTVANVKRLVESGSLSTDTTERM